MVQGKLVVFSTNENLRLCVIENSIHVEELISDIIGRILNIDWKTKKKIITTTTIKYLDNY